MEATTHTQHKAVTLYKESHRFDNIDWKAGLDEKCGKSTQRDLDALSVVDSIVATPGAASQDTQDYTRTGRPAVPHYTLSSSGSAMADKQHTFKAPSPARTPGRPTRPSLNVQSSSSSSLSSLRSRARRLSSEEIINEMENEQDAIVVRLLREIDQLKDENNRLRKNLCAVLNGDTQTPAGPAISRRSSLNSCASNSSGSGSFSSSHAGAGSGVLAATPTTSSPALSRRPSSSATPIDTLTPTLLLQRKRNSLSSSVPATPKNAEDFVDLYAPAPVSKFGAADVSLDAPGSCGYRRRRSSMKSTEGSNKLQRSTR
ncbi:LAQU0S01e12904g1_1 [Lachancea quebecensis]|uniref:LAQU0S01e12904g1_1 n=1 Tax=Lachancea quebecensis TaxID=1654605 RepID=A0A0P1KVM4_9SACH|nr:LAQU0S01e12904g1_1 [Lachancea quebecensis]